jgi:Glycosyltransferase (GlcNAc)
VKPISEQTIFISIASYCDPLLNFTIRGALNAANFPTNLRFGVVDQSPTESRMAQEGELSTAHIRYVQIDPRDSRGPCWARSVAMTLYKGEDWFFQIDSHMLFDKGWDEKLIEAALHCATINPKCILSNYPNAFEMIENEAVRKPVTQQVLAQVLFKDAQFEEGHSVLKFQATPVASDAPLIGFHIGAGCLFTTGAFVEEIPYDPHIYFHGEEQSIAARAYTHGWDIFHISGMPIYHLYNTASMEVPRARHWTEEHDKQRHVRWWILEAESKARVTALLNEERDLGIYGLGKQRTLADYAHFCGIDYANRTLNEKSRQGPWAVTA